MSAQSELFYVKELTHTICFYDIYRSHSEFVHYRDTIEQLSFDRLTIGFEELLVKLRDSQYITLTVGDGEVKHNVLC